MAGTNKAKTKQSPSAGPIVILVDPQLGENIGMVARAMLNCGLEHLRLVRPRDGWPNPAAISAAAGADTILDAAQLYDTTAKAVTDITRLYASSARHRDLAKPAVTPRLAAQEMRQFESDGESVGVLFGPERSGLVNDDIALADTLLTVPLNPAFASLNLAQAVLLVGYEWFQADLETAVRQITTGSSVHASKGEFVNFFERLEGLLDERGFLVPLEKRPGMVRNLRNMFQRMEPTEQDLRTLHGIVSALVKGKRGGGAK